MNLYANYSSWSQNVPRPQRVAPTTLTPWADISQTSFNLAYFSHFDNMMDLLAEAGIVAHLMITVWNKFVNWPELLRQQQKKDKKR